MASLSVRVPLWTGRTSAPSSFMRRTLEDWRSTSSAPMKTMHSSPRRAAAAAVATPCWPAPVSATSAVLPICLASSACPSVLLTFVRAGVQQILAFQPQREAEPFWTEWGSRLGAFPVPRSCGADRPAPPLKVGEGMMSRMASSSSWSGGMSSSGTKHPPNSPEVTFFHDYPLRAVNAARIREGSLRPGSDSRPELKSTPPGTQAATVSLTFFRSEPAGQQPGAGSVQAAQPFGADPFSAAASGHPPRQAGTFRLMPRAGSWFLPVPPDRDNARATVP